MPWEGFKRIYQGVFKIFETAPKMENSPKLMVVGKNPILRKAIENFDKTLLVP